MLLLEKKLIVLFRYFIISLAFIGNVSGQEKEKYILGEAQKLEIIVHIIGEVQKPGEYRVLDNTNVLELLSKSGGPTEFSNLSSVTIVRVGLDYFANNGSADLNSAKRIIRVNLNDYLKKPTATPPTKLQPGDVVIVPRNSWHKWRYVFTVMRDISVVVSVYFLYLRATK